MDQKNMIIAIALSVAIIFGFQFFYELPRQQEAQRLAEQQAESAESTVPTPQASGESASGGAAPAPGGASGEVTGQSREEILAADPRLEIRSDKLIGSIRLTGGRLDDLILLDYRQELDENSPPIRLLNPAGGGEGYFADIGWSSADTSLALPANDTLWQAEGGSLSPGNPVTLTWENGQGLTFERRFAVDAHGDGFYTAQFSRRA